MEHPAQEAHPGSQGYLVHQGLREKLDLQDLKEQEVPFPTGLVRLVPRVQQVQLEELEVRKVLEDTLDLQVQWVNVEAQDH